MLSGARASPQHMPGPPPHSHSTPKSPRVTKAESRAKWV